jgi:hypothetical protein
MLQRFCAQLRYNPTNALGRGFHALHDRGGLSGQVGGAGVSLWRRLGLKACFVAGTQMETATGWRTVESLRVGDKLLSRDEHDPHAPVVESVIEEVFVRTGKVVWLVLANGLRIGTTLEHPFYVPEQGWVAVAHLRVGSELALRDGSTVRVEAIVDDGEYAEVYNFRIAGTHTYFVGCDEWGFSVWAHNADCLVVKQHRYGHFSLAR